MRNVNGEMANGAGEWGLLELHSVSCDPWVWCVHVRVRLASTAQVHQCVIVYIVCR